MSLTYFHDNYFPLWRNPIKWKDYRKQHSSKNTEDRIRLEVFHVPVIPLNIWSEKTYKKVYCILLLVTFVLLLIPLKLVFNFCRLFKALKNKSCSTTYLNPTETMKKIHGAKTIIFMPILKHSIANSVSFPVPWVKWRYIQAERDRGTETAKTQFAIIREVCSDLERVN